MRSSALVRMFGFPATLVHGDTLVLDRWMWLRSRLPTTRNGERLVDIGCGSGAFSIGAALRGYSALGLSWDEHNQQLASERATLCSATTASFEICDVRALDARHDFAERFDVALCCENIEHVIDDRKLMRDIAACLRPGGRLLLTAPYLLYRPISREDMGPFLPVEDGRHVRRGYSPAMMIELCGQAGLVVERISFCSGYTSQKATSLMRMLTRLHPILGWIAVLPLRILPPLLDPVIARITNWPGFSICLEAYKPRQSLQKPSP